jgi:hypothetical protein
MGGSPFWGLCVGLITPLQNNVTKCDTGARALTDSLDKLTNLTKMERGTA